MSLVYKFLVPIMFLGIVCGACSEPSSTENLFLFDEKSIFFDKQKYLVEKDDARSGLWIIPCPTKNVKKIKLDANVCSFERTGKFYTFYNCKGGALEQIVIAKSLVKEIVNNESYFEKPPQNVVDVWLTLAETKKTDYDSSQEPNRSRLIKRFEFLSIEGNLFEGLSYIILKQNSFEFIHSSYLTKKRWIISRAETNEGYNYVFWVKSDEKISDYLKLASSMRFEHCSAPKDKL